MREPDFRNSGLSFVMQRMVKQISSAFQSDRNNHLNLIIISWHVFNVVTWTTH
jgi:hypothetical protein